MFSSSTKVLAKVHLRLRSGSAGGRCPRGHTTGVSSTTPRSLAEGLKGNKRLSRLGPQRGRGKESRLQGAMGTMRARGVEGTEFTVTGSTVHLAPIYGRATVRSTGNQRACSSGAGMHYKPEGPAQAGKRG